MAIPSEANPFIALDYLVSREFSIGHGQCPECYGLSPRFAGHRDDKLIGHKTYCKNAEAIRSLGGKPVMIGEFKSPKENVGLQTLARIELNKAFEKQVYESLAKMSQGSHAD